MGYFELALLEALVVGALCGIVGAIVVLRKRAFFTVALTHATFPGGIAAAILGLNVIFGAAVFSVVLVLAMTAISRVSRQGSQVASGVVLTAGFALGTLLQSLNPSLPIQVDTFLVGSILTVSTADVIAAAVVLLAAVLAILLFGKELLFSSFDPTGYRAAGYRAWTIDLLALGLIAATVVTVMPAIGSILAISLIVAPAAAARLFTRTITGMLVLGVIFGAVAGVLGLLFSRMFAIAAGGSIALTAAALFLVALGFDRLKGLRLKR